MVEKISATNPEPMVVHVPGVGAWGPGFNHWEDLRGLLTGERDEVSAQLPGPKPEVIPANERRRAPLMVRLAVETSQQAATAANMPPETLGCVFGSGHGDTDITDYMCRTLNTEAKQLSPTKFHNSVHNAAAGYWTISTDCMRSANSIAGFNHTASLSLLEAVSQCLSEREPMLLTLFDAPVCKVLQPILDNKHPFGASLIIADGPSNTHPTLEIVIDRSQSADSDWSPLPGSASLTLSDLFAHNPAARILSLLASIAAPSSSDHEVMMPLGGATRLIARRLS